MNPKNNNKLAITVLLAAKNEELNISKCLESLRPAEKIYVLDSHSSDRTAEISKSFGAEVIQFNYSGGYPKKRQWAMESLDIQTSWLGSTLVSFQIYQHTQTSFQCSSITPSISCSICCILSSTSSLCVSSDFKITKPSTLLRNYNPFRSIEHVRFFCRDTCI